MLILAGVSINAIVGDNGVLTKTTYASFFSEMSAVEEAVQMWKAGEIIEAQGDEVKAIPANGLCNANDLTSAERLVGEVGYYRVWSLTSTMPTTDILSSADTFNSSFESELVFYPAGVQDLYYLNNEALEIKGNKTYLIDATTGMIFSMTGISLKGVRCYSLNMARAVMNETIEQPLFAEAEVSGTGSGEKLAGNVQSEYLMDENGNYILDESGNKIKNPDYNQNGFRIITSRNSNNIYKLYNNGDLYGKGTKSISLGNTKSEMASLDVNNWTNFTIPSTAGNVKKIYYGRNTVYVINSNDELWAYGTNDNNKLGLNVEQQKEFTGRDLIQISIKSNDNKEEKIDKVFEAGDCTWVITKENKVYGAGYNGTYYSLGVGQKDMTVNEFSLVQGLPNEEIKIIDGNGNDSGNTYVGVLMNNGDIYKAGYVNKTLTKSDSFVKVIDHNDISTNYSSKIKKITFKGSVLYALLENGTIIYINSENQMTKIDLFSNVVDIDSGWSPAPVIIRDSNNDVYFYGSLSNAREQKYLGLDTDAYYESDGKIKSYLKLNDYMPEEMKKNDYIKYVKMIGNSATGFAVIYVMNSGRVWGSGQIGTLGLPVEFQNAMSDNGLALSCLIGNGNVQGISKLKDVKIKGFSNDIFTLADQKCYSIVLIDEDENYYTNNVSSIMFGDNILEKSWKKISSNVKDIFIRDSSTLAYIDKNNDAYIAMSDFTMFGEESLEEISNSDSYFRKVTDINIAGKIKKIVFSAGSTFVLTTDNKLYVGNKGKYDSSWVKSSYNGMGGNPLSRQTLLASNTTDICDFFASCIYFSNKKSYFTGAIYGQGTGLSETYYDNATEFVIEDLDTDKVVKMETVWEETIMLMDDGSIFLGGYRSNYGNMPGKTKLSRFTYEDLGLDGKIIDYAWCGKSYDSLILLTETGSLYGVGPEYLLGINSPSSSLKKEFIKLNVGSETNNNKVVSIHGMLNAFIAVKSDGSVWGTGFNEYGILGRWSGIGRGTSNSRYKTALNWVECPELEI
ncbi:MAG: hypothetical protein J6A36_04495 [Clostridia bacterium]|nr:hypothetical protein [Clostridia bacterium]